MGVRNGLVVISRIKGVAQFFEQPTEKLSKISIAENPPAQHFKWTLTGRSLAVTPAAPSLTPVGASDGESSGGG